MSIDPQILEDLVTAANKGDAEGVIFLLDMIPHGIVIIDAEEHVEMFSNIKSADGILQHYIWGLDELDPGDEIDYDKEDFEIKILDPQQARRNLTWVEDEFNGYISDNDVFETYDKVIELSSEANAISIFLFCK